MGLMECLIREIEKKYSVEMSLVIKYLGIGELDDQTLGINELHNETLGINEFGNQSPQHRRV